MSTSHPADTHEAAIETFIAHWQGREGGQERANYQLFLVGLCRLLGLPEPNPADASHERNDYVFERVVRKQRDDGEALGRIDLYRRDCFVLEAKQSRLRADKRGMASQEELFQATADAPRGRRGAGRAWDVLMLNAKKQAEDYAKALPTSHGWPPFLLVCDVGHCIEVYADFSGQGKNYTQFPDRRSFRIYLEDLRRPEIRDRLKRIWLDPPSLVSTRIAAKATREIAERLAAVSKALEIKKYPAEEVALFLMRCLFTMFAEDVGLLPEQSFSGLLADCRNDARKFVPLLEELWRAMNNGGFAASIREHVRCFNGNLFANARVIPLEREEIGELAAAADKDWREVEPAIFGTLLEQALDPKERKRLGAHYTPRAYVERLVVATIIEPLREDWRSAQSYAETLRAAGDLQGAAAEVQAFHDKLCETRVLDPACGTGNFLYVALELMKRLEGEVLEALADLGGQERLTGLAGHTIDPHQFLGLEINPRAAAIAELVLWIGYLQWHFRTRGGMPSEPILRAFSNIKVMDAVLTWDGSPVPQVADGQETYPNPRRPDWPEAEFIVGNPPFIGKGSVIRDALGDAYVEALWDAHPHINASADFVMYWWDRAAEFLTSKRSTLRRFGFVTTNSITQEFSRRVMKKRMDAKAPISLLMAIPDHPWTKVTKDAAAVRIAMTVGVAGTHDGVLLTVASEESLNTDQPAISFSTQLGKINSDIRIGTDATSISSLTANHGLCYNGMMLASHGFIISPKEAEHLHSRDNSASSFIKSYVNGSDLVRTYKPKAVIDFYGLTIEQARQVAPHVYQHILSSVKPERDRNRDMQFRTKWWLFGRSRPDLRVANSDIERFIATTETAKHRLFQFLRSDFIPDHMVLAISVRDAFYLGILSSRIHRNWSLTQGATLEDRPRYTKSACFDPFPFPDPPPSLKSDIRLVAEELDAFRKARQAEHPRLTLTQMYNVLEKLKAMEAASRAPSSPDSIRGSTSFNGSTPDDGDGRVRPGHDGAGTALTADEERIKDEGLILILKELHERLDRLVFQAYGWPETLSDEEILSRLVALNKERAEEEKRGLVRWLRPDYQIPRFAKSADRQAAAEEGAQVSATLHVLEPKQKPGFPTRGFEQSAAVFAALAASRGPVDAAAIAATFKQGRKVEPKIAAILASLTRLGHIATTDGGRTFALRRVA